MEQWQILVTVIVFLYIIFRKKIWGWLDPIFLLLAIRIATALVVVINFALLPNIGPGTLHLFLCLLVFLLSLYYFSPTSAVVADPSAVASDRSISKLLNVGLLLFCCKLVLMLFVFKELPIFSGEKGSDSYISFDVDNKVVSSFLLGLGSAETIILACVVPLLRKKKDKLRGRLALILSALIAVAALKKSALLGVLFALAFGEYLRRHFFRSTKPVFLKPNIILPAVFLAFSWAYYVYSSTVAISNFLSINDILNFAPYQFMNVYQYYASGIIYDFAPTYKFNPFLYFFHSILSPAGFPAFAASIGPSLHEFQTGDLSGNGVNPTFIVEGYVVFGWYLSLYFALFLGFLLGSTRKVLLRKYGDDATKVALCALLLPLMYTLTVDSLLAIKQLLVCLSLITCYWIGSKLLRVLSVISKPVDGCTRVQQ